MADQQAPGTSQLPGLSPTELELLKKMFSSPLDVPQEFRAWMIGYFEANPPEIPFSQVFGAQSYIDENVSNIQAHAPEVVTSLPTSPIDGKCVMLRVGSAPFVYVTLFYDATERQWVSENFPCGGANGAQTTSDSFQAIGGAVGVPWSPVHTAGLTMQLKWAGTLNGASTQADAEVLITWSDGSSSFTTSGVMDQSSAGDGVTRAVGVDWTTISDPGPYAMAVIGMQAKRAGAGATTLSAGIVGRYIKSV